MVSKECLQEGKNLMMAVGFTESIKHDVMNIMTMPSIILEASKRELIDPSYFRGLNVTFLSEDVDAMLKHLGEAKRNEEIEGSQLKNYTTRLSQLRDSASKRMLSSRDLDAVDNLSKELFQQAVDNIVSCEARPKRVERPPPKRVEREKPKRRRDIYDDT